MNESEIQTHIPDWRQAHFEAVLPIIKRTAKSPALKFNYLVLKRGADILLSSLAIVLILSWLVPILMIMIFIDTRGSVLFIQERIGKDNLPFKCIKLRTIHLPQSREVSQISGFCRFLRNSKLDEFTQFINVLKGEMSIVGPRPHMLSDHLNFSKALGSQYFLRHKVLPGITGLAQIKGYAGPVTSHPLLVGRIRMDLLYIEKWSLGLDFWIMFKTVILLFKPIKNEPIG